MVARRWKRKTTAFDVATFLRVAGRVGLTSKIPRFDRSRCLPVPSRPKTYVYARNGITHRTKKPPTDARCSPALPIGKQ